MKYQRKQKITQYLMQNGSASISELSKLCDISEMTVRRYLNELKEDIGIELKRGGAVYPFATGEIPFQYKLMKGYELSVKRKLAQFAVNKFVKDNMIICLEGGTTVRCISDYLSPYRSLTIFSNGVNTIASLYNINPSSIVICSGGILRPVNNTLVGPVAVNFFKNYNADIGFFSSIGLTLENGFTDADVMECQIRNDMSHICEKAILITTSDKIGVRSASTTFRFDEVDVWITDSNAPAEFVNEIKAKGIETYVVDISDLDIHCDEK